MQEGASGKVPQTEFMSLKPMRKDPRTEKEESISGNGYRTKPGESSGGGQVRLCVIL